MTHVLPYTPEDIQINYSIDVFAETVGKLTLPSNPAVITMLQAQCWQRFRRRSIGDFDYEYWLVLFNDQVLTSWEWYKRVAEKYLDATATDLETATVSITETTNTTTDQDGTVSNESDTTGTNELENNPDVAAGTTKYLTNRGATTNNVIASATTTDDIVVDGSRTVTDKRSDGMMIERINKLADGLKAANVAFLRELDACFMNRW